MFRKAFLLPSLLLVSLSVSSQSVTEPKTNEDAEKLENEAVELLRETVAEVGGMRLVENRISFTSELASLMWTHDEGQARTMYAGVINDYRQLAAQLDAQ